jgi:peroxiredoxin Q/BCP
VSSVDAPWNLFKTRGQVVVLAFYPRDFTNGCTAEWQAFRDQGAELFGEGVVVAGISGDSVETHQRFAQSIGMPYVLLSDPQLKVADRFGAKDKQYSVAKRVVYVVGKDGRVRYRDLDFRALDPQSYAKLKAAVAAARAS